MHSCILSIKLEEYKKKNQAKTDMVWFIGKMSGKEGKEKKNQNGEKYIHTNLLAILYSDITYSHETGKFILHLFDCLSRYPFTHQTQHRLSSLFIMSRTPKHACHNHYDLFTLPRNLRGNLYRKA